MRAIVTGGAGFIGSHLVDRLLADGCEVYVVDNLASGSVLNVNPDAVFNPRSIREVEPPKADIIYHLASPVGPVGVLSQAGHIAVDVIRDARWVAGWALSSGCPLVYVSTSELYGPQTGACAETLNRVTPPGHSARMEYAVAKLAAETMLLNTASLDVRIVRPFNVAGPRQRPEGGFVLPRFIRQAKAGEKLTVYGVGSAQRAFTHVLDIVDGLVAVAARGASGDIYNLGNPDNRTTVYQLACAVLEQIVGVRFHYLDLMEFVDPRDLWGPTFAEAADKYPDATHAYERLSWRAQRPLSQVIRDAIRDAA